MENVKKNKLLIRMEEEEEVREKLHRNEYTDTVRMLVKV